MAKQLLAKETIISKAYELMLGKLEEGYLSAPVICYANNSREARVNMFQKVKYDGWRLKWTKEELTYLNIPVRRSKRYDKVNFEGREIARWYIDEILNERQRISKLDEIAMNQNVEYCYIIKGSYYRPNSCGYTSFMHEAGVYPKEEAISHAKQCKDIRLETVDIEYHNKIITDKINDLQSRIIKSQ